MLDQIGMQFLLDREVVNLQQVVKLKCLGGFLVPKNPHFQNG